MSPCWIEIYFNPIRRQNLKKNSELTEMLVEPDCYRFMTLRLCCAGKQLPYFGGVDNSLSPIK